MDQIKIYPEKYYVYVPMTFYGWCKMIGHIAKINGAEYSFVLLKNPYVFVVSDLKSGVIVFQRFIEPGGRSLLQLIETLAPKYASEFNLDTEVLDTLGKSLEKKHGPRPNHLKIEVDYEKTY